MAAAFFCISGVACLVVVIYCVLKERRLKLHRRQEGLVNSLRAALLDKERAENARIASLNEELLRLGEMKDEFVATVSHELRTPLTSIGGYIEMLLDGVAGELNSEQEQFLQTIERNSARLINLVDDLLFSARVDAGGVPVTVMSELDLGTAVKEAMESARINCPFEHIEFKSRTETPLIVAADPARLTQLLDNLVNNALKFMPEGGTISVDAHKEGESAIVTVSDTGIGIPLGEQHQLFNRFFRSSLAKEREIIGSGIGLAVVKAITDAHGGEISIRSEEGVGTTVRLSLPRREVSTG